MSHDLRVDRLIDASPEEVFDAFTDPAAQTEWYRDQPGWTVDVAGSDLRVGGGWHVSFGEPGNVYQEIVRIEEYDPPRRLVYAETFVSPDGSRFQTTVTVTFQGVGGKTRLVVEQTGFPSEAVRDAHQGGWPNFLARLERVVLATA